MQLVDLFKLFIDIFLHLEDYLELIINAVGPITYVVLFLIIFAETGFVVTPFLPGDSLIFAAASFAGLGMLNPWIIFISLAIAGILGDTINYTIGHYIGPRVFREDVRFLKREYLDRTHEFYEKHGGKTIILARFVPIVRTFAPFIAGVGAMTYRKFVAYNVIGAIVWVATFTLLGYYFGTIPFVEENFSTVILAIIFISLIPPVYEGLKARQESKQTSQEKKDIDAEGITQLFDK
jgi:membrane-associated protein